METTKIISVEFIQATEMNHACTLIELSQAPTMKEMDELFTDESVVLCF